MKARIASWINEHRKVWRAATLIVLVVAIMGPWTFEVVWVPSEPTFAPCSTPYIRLDENFCGTPMSGRWLLGWMVSGFAPATSGLVKGDYSFSEWARDALVVLLTFLPVLPFFSTLLLILLGDRRRRQVFNIVAWGLAVGIGLLIGLFSYPRLLWVLWGIWLYVGLAAAVVTVELLAIRSPGV